VKFQHDADRDAYYGFRRPRRAIVRVVLCGDGVHSARMKQRATPKKKTPSSPVSGVCTRLSLGKPGVFSLAFCFSCLELASSGNSPLNRDGPPPQNDVSSILGNSREGKGTGDGFLEKSSQGRCCGHHCEGVKSDESNRLGRIQGQAFTIHVP